MPISDKHCKLSSNEFSENNNENLIVTFKY